MSVTERGALLALLRTSGRSWATVTDEVEAAGSALEVLSGAVVPARPLAAQVHALHAAAAFLGRAGISRLSLSVHDDRVTIQVPADMGALEIRIAAVARLAAAAGSQPYPEAGGSAPTAIWPGTSWASSPRPGRHHGRTAVHDLLRLPPGPRSAVPFWPVGGVMPSGTRTERQERRSATATM
jgi:hypothetical protein